MTLIVRPGFQFDDDASTYIEAVEVADTQALETATRYAINDFVIGCKQDGIWSAIKASCILAGARTLTGALVPLVGTAPTNVDGLFVSGDYDRKTGLVGNGSTKYLNSNRNNNADPQNNHHLSFFPTSLQAGYREIGSGANSGSSSLGTGGIAEMAFRSRNSAAVIFGSRANKFCGISRNNASSVDWRVNETSGTGSQNSQSPANQSIEIFRAAAFPSASRLAFYSIGESLDLALLDARVSALITAFGVAIP